MTPNGCVGPMSHECVLTAQWRKCVNGADSSYPLYYLVCYCMYLAYKIASTVSSNSISCHVQMETIKCLRCEARFFAYKQRYFEKATANKFSNAFWLKVLKSTVTLTRLHT